MAMQDCLNLVKAASGDILSDKQAMDLLDGVDALAQRLAREEGLTPREAVAAAAKRLGEQAAAAAKIEERNRLLNLQKRVARRAAIEAKAVELGSAAKPNYPQAIRNQIVAIFTPTEGGRFSAEAQWKTRSKEYWGGLAVKLQRAGLLDTFRDGSIEREWVRELWELSKGDKGRPGVTGNAPARMIAEAIHGFQQLARERLNREGAWIGEAPGYITRQSHDVDLLRRAGYAAWRDFIQPRLDARTFDGVPDREKFLRGIFNGLYTGTHLSDGGGVGYKDPAFSGPANLARKISAERVLHFKDADAWLDYQKKFGTGALNEQIVASLDRAARQEALLRTWGTNPRAEFDADLKFLAERNRDGQTDAVAALGDKRRELETLFGTLDGSANMPGNRVVARIAGDIRTVESMAKLGAVAFTHLSSGVTKAAELRYHGVGLLERWGNFFGSLFEGRGRGEMRELADVTLAGVEGMHGAMLSRFQPDDTVAGTLSKLATRFFKLTGLTYLLDAQKAGTVRALTRHFGMMLDRAHDALPEETRRTLQLYGISPEEWEVLRTAPDHFEHEKRVYFTPEAAKNADAGKLEALLRAKVPVGPPELAELMKAVGGIADDATPETVARKVAAYRDALALKVDALLSDIADRTIVQPGIAERARLNAAAPPGTVPGELVRFMSQFKLWGYAAFRQGVGRELRGGQSGLGAASGIAQMALSTALLGYIVLASKRMIRGQYAPPPNRPETWAAALISGGGFGIMADFVFAEHSRTGGGIGETLLGPVLGGAVTDTFTLWNDLKGEALGDDRTAKRARKDIGPDMLKIVKDNTPFINLFYTRLALDWLFLHSAQESMNPGYLERYQRRVEQQQGVRYWLGPTNHVKTFGR